MASKDAQFFIAEKLFTGDEWLANKAVQVAGGKIVAIVDAGSVADLPATHHQIIAPAFIDIQIYGAHGKLLAVYPEAGSLHRLYDYCSKGGASHFQPTVATNSYEVFYRCIDDDGAFTQFVFVAENADLHIWIVTYSKLAYNCISQTGI